jgi:hypothetical protein
MIDREARRSLALSLRRFGSGRTTARALLEVVVQVERSPDRGVRHLCDEIYWAFLNYGPGRLVGRDALTRLQRRSVARWVLFLLSDETYGWQCNTTLDQCKALFQLQPLYRGGDRTVWPFVSAERLRQVADGPPFPKREHTAG